jgi:glycosyltransferase involved in cell wall biosynthesis
METTPQSQLNRNFSKPDVSMNSPEARPKLSVVVVCYEMAAQVKNTLQTLLPPYQRNISIDEYEIILIDNGSAKILDDCTRKISPNLDYIYLSPNESSPSPAAAMNRGVALSRAPRLCLMIDGARLVTPGVLSWGMRLLELSPRAMVEVRGWHLGPKWQPESVMEGYDLEQERELLESVRWPENGYRLWEIAAATHQTYSGFSAKIAESNCIFMSRDLFFETGGFDERSRAPGGGFVNADFFSRAVAGADRVFTLLGEGTFHQMHGGAATGLAKPRLQQKLKQWRAESEALGQVIGPDYEFILAGHMPLECASWLARNAAASA